jgi:hypothetical protein
MASWIVWSIGRSML